MPNEPIERDRDSRQPHARPLRGSAGSSGAPRRQGSGLRKPAGAGVIVVALVALDARRHRRVRVAQPQPGRRRRGRRDPRAHRRPDARRHAGGSRRSHRAAARRDRGAGGVIRTGTIGRRLRRTPALVPAKRLQRAIDEYRAKTGIPGISVAVVWDDGRSWAGATGLRDVGRKLPVATGTAFPFASVSKTLTAAVVLQLVDEGKVDLDAPAARYLPAYSLDKRITVRMLMDHRSSLPDFFANRKIDRALQGDKDATWTAARAWKYVPKVAPQAGHDLRLLEHELPAPRRARGARDEQPAVDGGPHPAARPAPAHHRLVPGGRGAEGEGRPRLPPDADGERRAAQAGRRRGRTSCRSARS